MKPFGTDLERRLRARYTQASRQLDPATVHHLQQARQQALDAIDRPLHRARLLLPAGAFAVVALAAILIWQPSQRASLQAGASAVSGHEVAKAESDRYLPPDADSDDARLYQDLDFYGWLASTDSGDEASSP